MGIHRPVHQNRYFYKGTKYSDIKFADLKQAIEAFHWKINEWYILPADLILRAGFDYAFALMDITCQLIDTLSQYHRGKTTSSQEDFKKFIVAICSDFGNKLPQDIEYVKPSGKQDKLNTFADVLYVAFRCGILHESHVPLYGGLAGLDGKMFDADTDICAEYVNGNPCPTVRMDPTKIYPLVKRFFEDYSRT